MTLSTKAVAVGLGLFALVVAVFAITPGKALIGLLSLGALAGGMPVVMGAAFENSDIVRQLAAWGVLDQMGGVKLSIKIKTADYTVVASTTASTGDRSGTIFTNRGATGTVVFTLPAPAAALAGTFYEFLGIADYRIDVKTATADTLIVLNDITADYLSMQTGGALIGAHMRLVCDGTSWIAYGDAVGVTYTVST